MDKADLLLEAAARRFALYGFRRTVLDDIARDAGIAKGSIYLHATSKEDLFMQVVSREQRLMTEAASEAAAGHEDPRLAIEAIIRRMPDWLVERPLMGRLMTGDPELGIGPELGRQIEGACQGDKPLFTLIGALVTTGVERGIFRRDLVVEAPVSIVVSMFHIYLHNRRQRFIELDDETFLRELMRILFEGIQIHERGLHEDK
ncbi:MAG: helix-turn-helix domain-containing protein [bacterium]|jgi:AcrR family transcriptional regulator|nr:helix-turn-helix domain-containing protein [bacterium]